MRVSCVVHEPFPLFARSHSLRFLISQRLPAFQTTRYIYLVLPLLQRSLVTFVYLLVGIAASFVASWIGQLILSIPVVSKPSHYDRSSGVECPLSQKGKA